MNQKQLNQKIEEFKAMIDEQKEWGNFKIAKMFEQELNSLLANNELVGNKPRLSPNGLILL